MDVMVGIDRSRHGGGLRRLASADRGHPARVRLMTPGRHLPVLHQPRPDQIDHTEPFQHRPDAVGAGQSRIGNHAQMSTPSTGSRPTADGGSSNPSRASTCGAPPTAPTTSSTTPAPAPYPEPTPPP